MEDELISRCSDATKGINYIRTETQAIYGCHSGLDQSSQIQKNYLCYH